MANFNTLIKRYIWLGLILAARQPSEAGCICQI
ncbi:hypothetical protein BANRA_05309 [Klebsiella pneumoniae]|nr:hypothetical protein BANRA_05309 [Klebsiella pneumoniae]